MLELDQILRANELTISLVAAVPALAISGAVLDLLYRLLLRRSAPDPRREAAPVRWAAHVQDCRRRWHVLLVGG